MIPTGPVPGRALFLAASLLVWCTARGAADARPVQVPLPVFEGRRISLEGRWGPPASPSGAPVLTLGYRATIYEFQLVRLRVLTGSVLYSRILADVQPYRPNFLLRGPRAEMRKLAAIRPGEHVVIIGWIPAGGNDVLVSSILVVPPAAAAPAR